MSRETDLAMLIKGGKTTEAAAMARTPADYHEGELFVITALGRDPAVIAPAEVLDAALEGFLGTRQHSNPAHGYWVHSLSHFTEQLWRLRLMEWLKRLHEAAFLGANQLGDINCSNRLVVDYEAYARWDDDPAALGYTTEGLAWTATVNTKYIAGALGRIRACPFADEAAYLQWKADQA